MVAGMTDLECMRHRFSRVNLKKSTGTIAQVLGVSRKDYEAAVERGMAQEAQMLKEKSPERHEVVCVNYNECLDWL